MRLMKIPFLILLFGSLSSHSCSSDNQDPEPPAENNPVVKVMSYNIHIGNPPSKESDFRDLQAIAYVINLAKPDLVALSEVDNKTRRSGITIHQAKELAKLTDMHYFFTKAIDYQGGEYGDAVLSKLPILDSTRYELPTTASNFEARSVAMITVEKEGHKFHFGSTHLDHTSDDANRVLQAKELNKIIEKLSLPVIIAGDLNALPDSKPIEILHQTLTPTCRTSCPLTFPAIKPNRTLDYIMYRPKQKFNVESLKVLNETYASDHLPVLAELSLMSK
ncbi:hypothetical protein KCTC52924_00416 [Arenibacter antarcticus]|uniref:Endonuclease/exonuclease/phosphatase family protein n=1 Tax=Arenibacter antarcticus TaxID=2040469 RepID=A0ABW5VBP1_9FLAO|nr:endonuclease/exonuclease/phosphatase family protein [Arenibacter sp. H213]MCM4169383.1 endonuclease [Arenibacter sp. H213]